MAEDNKTEKATEHRRQKAREEGQVARSRELGSAAALLAGISVLASDAPTQLLHWRQFMRAALDQAATGEITMATPLFPWAARLVVGWAWKPLSAAAGVAVVAALVQGGFIFAPKLLAPNFERLNPGRRLGQIFSLLTVVQLAKALVPSTLILYLAFGIFEREWPTLALGIWASPRQIAAHLFGLAFELFWKSSLVLLGWAAVDYMAMRQKFEGDLRMSKEEIREESKQLDGNPHTRMRIRRLQRQARRQRMIKAAKRATVVVTNPTHFAVALEYQADMAAPIVVAKGQNLLALQIREIARWEGIPIVENPPLAQTLYRTVEVDQAIPEKLYAAVAEVLAYVFRMSAESRRAV